MRTRRTGEASDSRTVSSGGKETVEEEEEECDASVQRCLNQTRREGEEQQRGGEGIHWVEEMKRMEEQRTSRDTDPRLLRLT